MPVVTRPAAERSRARTAAVMGTLALCGTVMSLQQTIVVPLLPDFPRLLDTTADNASWLVTATLLTGAVATPVVSRLADMYGKRLMMTVTLGVMVVGSVVGALSGTSLELAVLARALQGVGMALVPVGIATMRDELPPHRVPLGVALMSATLAIGAGAGLPLSGLVAEHLDWHALFWITAAAGAVMLVAVPLVVSESLVRTRGRFDYRGALLLSAALTMVLLAVSKGGTWGWTSPLTLAVGVGGLLLIGLWVPLELRVPSPLVDVRTAARPAVLLVNMGSVLIGFAMFANLLVSTQLLQLPRSTGYGLGLDVVDTGLWMAPSALVFGILAPVSASITRRFGPQTTLAAGAVGMALAYVARVFLSHSLWQIVVGSMLVGVGTSLTYAAMPILIMRAVPVTETASANGLNTLLRSIGTSMSSATVAAVVTMSALQVGGSVYPTFGALMAVFWIAAASSAIGALLAIPLFRMVDFQETGDEQDRQPDTVAQGSVVTAAGRPVGNAVVTVLGPLGQHVDWSPVDSAGHYAVAIPGPGHYLVVVSAEGWRPLSRLLELTPDKAVEPLQLLRRLDLEGSVSTPHGPLPRAGIVLTRSTGEVVATTRADDRGRYAFPLPAPGHYVVTAVDRTSRQSTSLAVALHGGTPDIDLLVPDVPSASGGGDLAPRASRDVA
ncbi:MFS transporter [Janibacter sp. G1551]|uniref:MFS transporter n=1 Tax=Janibacter sp. G1551 TaxID=3420440 RepID=UPI003D067339